MYSLGVFFTRTTLFTITTTITIFGVLIEKMCIPSWSSLVVVSGKSHY